MQARVALRLCIYEAVHSWVVTNHQPGAQYGITFSIRRGLDFSLG
jgi:hypothetical protein